MLAFFKKVLPSSGVLVVGTKNILTQKYEHYTTEDANVLANMAASLDTNPATEVFFATASFKTGWHDSGKFCKTTGRALQQLRTQSNVAYKRCFYVDLDVKQGSDKQYATKKEALRAIIHIARNVMHKQPVIVETKNGYHAYWLLDSDVAVSAWQPIAEAFKQRLKQEGVLLDLAVSADSARVLRPPQTTHRKSTEHSMVSVVFDNAEPASLAHYATVLGVSTTPTQHSVVQNAAAVAAAEMLAAMGVGMTPPIADSQTKREYDAAAVYATCKQLQVAGGGTYMQWFGAISVLAKCVDGAEVIHKMSCTDPRYSVQDTDVAIADAVARDKPPMLCATFEDHNEQGCVGCPFRGLGKTPLHVNDNPAQAVRADIVPRYIRDAFLLKDMKGFRLSTDQDTFGMYAKMKVVDESTGDMKTFEVRLAEVILMPTYTMRLLDTGALLTYWQEVRADGTVCEHDLPTKTLNSPQLMGEWLSNALISVLRGNTLAMTDLLHTLFCSTSGSIPKSVQHAQFGWINAPTVFKDGKEYPGEPGFVIGEKVLWPNQPPRKSLMAPSAQLMQQGYAAAGTREAWHKMLSVFYTPDMVWGQAVICAMLGGVLTNFLCNEEGMPLLYIYSKYSGSGKTTVANVGVSLYGKPAALKIAPHTSPLARIAILGTSCNIPVLNDEITATDPKILGEFLMAISQNKEKDRLTASGSMSSTGGRRWNTLAVATGNTPFAQDIANGSTLDLPLLARVVQVDLNHLRPHSSTNHETTALLNLKDTNYGLIGRDWIQHALDNYDNVAATVATCRREVSDEFGEVQSERIWGNLVATIKAGCLVGKAAGVHDFRWEDVLVEVKRWIAYMREQNNAAAAKQGDWFTQLVQHISQKTIVVRSDVRGAVDDPNGYVISRPQHGNAPTARLAVAEKLLYVPISEVKRFVSDNNLSLEQVRMAWDSTGLLIRADVQCKLDRYVPGHSMLDRTRCFLFDTKHCVDLILNETHRDTTHG